MDCFRKVRQGDSEYRLLFEYGSLLTGYWYVKRLKVEGDGAGKYVETFGPYECQADAMQAANWPEPKTELEELWELVRGFEKLVGDVGRFTTVFHEGQFRTDGTKPGSARWLMDRVNYLEAKWAKK